MSYRKSFQQETSEMLDDLEDMEGGLPESDMQFVMEMIQKEIDCEIIRPEENNRIMALWRKHCE